MADFLIDWRAREAQERERAEARAAEAKMRLCEALAPLGVIAATISYSGSGDSGDVDHIGLQIEGDSDHAREAAALAQTIVVSRQESTYHEATQQWVHTSAPEPMTIEDVLRELCWDLIALHGHNGFENNDGGEGEVTLTIATRSYEYQHRDFYTESESYDHEG